MSPVLLSIAGFDPTGGAGLLLDIRVFNSLGWNGMGITTAVTAQNTREVLDVFCLSRGSLARQYEALRDDVTIAGIKIGMLGCKKHLAAVGRILDENAGLPVVQDLVLKSSSGFRLFEESGLETYLRLIRGRVSVITPNIPEAAMLLDRKIASAPQMAEAAIELHRKTGAACLLKGGHLSGRKVDILYDGCQIYRFPHPEIKKRVHGTGCFLSSALLARLASGLPLHEAVEAAISRTLAGIKNSVPAGKGQYLFNWSGLISGLTHRQR
jgi:hydroxymethylpyrimidine/phosphomethylpyrimidine kinase